jgi:hypothetical protein
VHATLVPGSLEALTLERALPAPTTRDIEPRAASSASSARRPVIHLTEIRSKPGDDSASSSGAYLRVALSDAANAARPGRSTGAAKPEAKPEAKKPSPKPSEAKLAATPEPKPEPKPAVTSEARPEPKLAARPELRPEPQPDSRLRPVVSGDALRAAALHQAPANAAQASLSQISGTSDSIIAELPRSRNGWLVGGVIGLVAAAGVAALVLTRPDPEERGDVALNQPIARKLPASPSDLAAADPTQAADPDPSADPPRGAGLLPPGGPSTPDKPVIEPPDVDPAVERPAVAALPVREPDPDPKPGKKPKKPRTPRAVEAEEPDILDQVRAHMYKQKAEEDARNAALQASAAAKAEPLSDADKARETLDRARQASAAANLQLCFSLARQSNTLVKSPEALELMGTCACRLKNETSARVAFNALSGERRDRVAATCSASGITL